jgi:hypothetical protein
MRVALLFVGVATAASLIPAQADTYWHLRAGQDLFRSGHVPLIESYSHTAAGRAWPNHEWLWQALSYASYRLGGMASLTAMAALLSTAAFGLSCRLMRATPAVNFILCLIGVALTSVVWALRPQVASLFFLVALVALLARNCLWPVPPLFWVWANLHGAVALGGAVLVTATVVSAFADRRRWARLAVVTVVCGLLTAATPMGTGLWRFVGESMARSRSNQIMEWMPSYPRGPVEIMFWLAAAALAILVGKRWRRLQSWDDRLVVAVALLLVPFAARAVRNIAPFALLWMPAMSRVLRPPAPPRDQRDREDSVDNQDSEAARLHPRQAPDDHPTLNLVLLCCALLVAAVVVGAAWKTRWQRLGWSPLPAPLLVALHHCDANLYNRYNDGGYLIWFAPDIPVFIDSRQDPYPAELLSAQAAAEQSGEYASLFRRYQIRCSVLPTTSPVARHLARDGWQDIYRDATWAVQRQPR